jgi:hypothetical protein
VAVLTESAIATQSERGSPTGNGTPTVWFVAGILLSELLRLRSLSVTYLFILFIINLQEGAGAHYTNLALQAAVSHPRGSIISIVEERVSDRFSTFADLAFWWCS